MSANHIIIIKQGSDPEAKELLKTVVMSQVNYAFFVFLFKEIVIQAMVLMAAIFFIFLGLPVAWCLATIPIVAFIVYISTYAHHFMKASEINNIQPMSSWIAEAYEPYFMTTDPCDIKYEIINGSRDIKDITSATLKRKVIGIVYVRDCFGPVNSLWMYGLAVDPKYHRKGIGKLLVRNVMEFTKRRGYESLEFVITDLQNEARLMFLELGFKLKQIYHKKFFGMIPLGKYQMGVTTGAPEDFNFN